MADAGWHKIKTGMSGLQMYELILKVEKSGSHSFGRYYQMHIMDLEWMVVLPTSIKVMELDLFLMAHIIMI